MELNRSGIRRWPAVAPAVHFPGALGRVKGPLTTLAAGAPLTRPARSREPALTGAPTWCVRTNSLRPWVTRIPRPSEIVRPVSRDKRFPIRLRTLVADQTPHHFATATEGARRLPPARLHEDPRLLSHLSGVAVFRVGSHHCHIVTIRGNSYRMRQHTDLWQTLHAPQDPDPAPRRRRRARQEAATI